MVMPVSIGKKYSEGEIAERQLVSFRSLTKKRKCSKNEEAEKENIETIDSGCHQGHEAWRS